MNLKLIFWEITQKCNLSCPYCRRNDYSASFSLDEALKIVDSIAESYRPMLVFSGGEPLLYPHIFEVASYAHQKGLNRMNELISAMQKSHFKLERHKGIIKIKDFILYRFIYSDNKYGLDIFVDLATVKNP